MGSTQQSTGNAKHHGNEHAADTQHDMTELAQAHQGSTQEESIPAPSDMAGTEVWTTTETGMAAVSSSLPAGSGHRPDHLSESLEGEDSAAVYHTASHNPQVDKSAQEGNQQASGSE